MRKSFLFLISSLMVAGWMTGCSKGPSAPSPEAVDLVAAKKAKVPMIIYNVGVAKEESGMTRPVVYFVNTSPTPISVVTFQVVAHTKDGGTATLWADDYERVPPGKPSMNGKLGGGWKNLDAACIRITRADIQTNGTTFKYTEDNIAQLFQDPTLNRCPK